MERRLTTYLMLREETALCFPGCEPELASLELREVAESHDEAQKRHTGISEGGQAFAGAVMPLLTIESFIFLRSGILGRHGFLRFDHHVGEQAVGTGPSVAHFRGEVVAQALV